MRIGIFGGSFNPVHLGHLQVARSAKQQFQLDELLFIPAAIPPHKQNVKLISDEHRLAMLRLAINEKDGFRIEDDELTRGGISYTVDTVAALKARYPKGTSFFLVLGSDSLVLLPKWRDVERLLSEVDLIVYPRQDFPRSKISTLQGKLSAAELKKIEDGFLVMEPIEISATEIRRRLQSGESLEGLVPKEVNEYLRQHRIGL